MGKGRARDRDPQVGAIREVTGAQSPGLVDLGEKDFLGRSMQRPPLLDPPLQRPHLSGGEAARVLPLHMAQQGLGLQARVDLQQRLQLGPDVGERVRACPPVMFHTHLLGQLTELPVLAGGFLVHAGLGRGPAFGDSQQVEATETAHLLIGDHPKPPRGKGLRIAYAAPASGNSNCR